MKRRAQLALVSLAAFALAATSVPPKFKSQAVGSQLSFFFQQAGAETRGSFRSFTSELHFDQQNLPGSGLRVTVDTGSLDTGDKDRDAALRGKEFFDAARFPSAVFVANSLTRGEAGGYLASGKLTIRDVTRALSIPLTVTTHDSGDHKTAELRGSTTIKRLDFGVGQGEWRSTEWVADAVRVEYSVRLVSATP